MYTAFNLSLYDKSYFINDIYYTKGLEIYKQVKKYALNNLEEIIDGDIIDGDKLQNVWFPDKIFHKKSFVFISHSHNDEKIAIKLAGYLYTKFNVYSFIDSCVWGHINELNKTLNNCSENIYGTCFHCDCNEFSYNLSYVHMMLASALMTKIDKCECIFFLNTPSSINLNHKTESSWIYYELNIANITQKISRIKTTITENVSYFMREIEFTPKIEKMVNLTKKY